MTIETVRRAGVSCGFGYDFIAPDRGGIKVVVAQLTFTGVATNYRGEADALAEAVRSALLAGQTQAGLLPWRDRAYAKEKFGARVEAGRASINEMRSEAGLAPL